MKVQVALLLAASLALGACAKQAPTNDSATAAIGNDAALADANLLADNAAVPLDNGAGAAGFDASNGADAATGNVSNGL